MAATRTAADCVDRKELGAAQIAAEESGEGLPAAVGNLVSERAQASALEMRPEHGRAQASALLKCRELGVQPGVCDFVH